MGHFNLAGEDSGKILASSTEYDLYYLLASFIPHPSSQWGHETTYIFLLSSILASQHPWSIHQEVAILTHSIRSYETCADRFYTFFGWCRSMRVFGDTELLIKWTSSWFKPHIVLNHPKADTWECDLSK